MSEIIKQKLISITEKIHFRIFRQAMSEEMRNFLGHLSWSFLGGGIAAAVMMIINIGAGRLMGPIEYGKYGLVLAIGQIFMIPILFGLDISGVRLISKEKDEEQKIKNISSIFYCILFSSLVFILIFLIFHNFVSEKFNVNSTILSIAALYAIITSLRAIADIFARGFFLFKKQFFARIFELGTTTVLFSLFFFYYVKRNYIFYMLALLGGSLVFFFLLLKRYLVRMTRFDYQSLKKQISYSSIFMLDTTLATVFNSLNTLLIAKYLGVLELGIYMAYITASTGMVMQVTQMFINVFFPSVAKVFSKSIIIKLERLVRIFFIPGFIVISGIIFIIIKLFGKSYGISLAYICGFGLLANFKIISLVYYSIFTSSPRELYKKYLVYFNVINFFQLAAYGVLIYFNHISIGLIVILSIMNSIISLALQRRLITNSKSPVPG
jgi:O-antigen/teichoic acid export membrane protein